MRHQKSSFLYVVAGMASLSLVGCSQSPMVRNVTDVYRVVTSDVPEQPIDRQAIANLPYATIAAKVGKGQKSVLVLGENRYGNLEWVASDGVTLVTRNGRLVQTAGFEENIRATIQDYRDPLAEGRTDLDGMSSFRVLEVELEGQRQTVPVRSTYEVLGPEKIEIASLTFETILVRETNKSQTINWTFDNYYWLDPYNGFVWKSTQHFTRNLPPLEIEVLKPAA